MTSVSKSGRPATTRPSRRSSPARPTRASARRASAPATTCSTSRAGTATPRSPPREPAGSPPASTSRPSCSTPRRAVAPDVEWIEGDAQDLPFDDDSFDVVLSTFGSMFAPDHQRAADEIMRVVTPGGRIALASWTPEGDGRRLLPHGRRARAAAARRLAAAVGHRGAPARNCSATSHSLRAPGGARFTFASARGRRRVLLLQFRPGRGGARNVVADEAALLVRPARACSPRTAPTTAPTTASTSWRWRGHDLDQCARRDRGPCSAGRPTRPRPRGR